LFFLTFAVAAAAAWLFDLFPSPAPPLPPPALLLLPLEEAGAAFLEMPIPSIPFRRASAPLPPDIVFLFRFSLGLGAQNRLLLLLRGHNDNADAGLVFQQCVSALFGQKIPNATQLSVNIEL